MLNHSSSRAIVADLTLALQECLGTRYELLQGGHGPVLLGAGGMAVVYRADRKSVV